VSNLRVWREADLCILNAGRIYKKSTMARVSCGRARKQTPTATTTGGGVRCEGSRSMLELWIWMTRRRRESRDAVQLLGRGQEEWYLLDEVGALRGAERHGMRKVEEVRK
jgi:hypothetical protein